MQVPSDPIPRIIEASGNRREGQVRGNILILSKTRSAEHLLLRKTCLGILSFAKIVALASKDFHLTKILRFWMAG